MTTQTNELRGIQVETTREAVKDYIRRKIDASSKSQVQIAEETGFSKPNVLSMIKTGRTAVPLARIPALARAINVEPKILLAMCLREYKPSLFEVLKEVYEIPSGSPKGHEVPR